MTDAFEIFREGIAAAPIRPAPDPPKEGWLARFVAWCGL